MRIHMKDHFKNRENGDKAKVSRANMCNFLSKKMNWK